MPAKLLTVADAVVALLNEQEAGTFALAFTATRIPVRIVALEHLSQVDVAVVTGEGSCSNASPADGTIERDLEFYVEVRQRINDVSSNREVDPLITLLQQIADLLLNEDGSEVDDNAFCRHASYAYAVTELETQSQFVGVLTLGFGVNE